MTLPTAAALLPSLALLLAVALATTAFLLGAVIGLARLEAAVVSVPRARAPARRIRLGGPRGWT
jgi:hypothetical protein